MLQNHAFEPFLEISESECDHADTDRLFAKKSRPRKGGKTELSETSHGLQVGDPQRR